VRYLLRIQHSLQIFEFMEAQKPAAIVHTTSDSGKRHPLTIMKATLAQQLHERGSYAGIREVAVVAKIIDEFLHD
jgi:hypothetical protein